MKSFAIAAILIADVLYIGGATYLCAFMDWSLWTFFWFLLFDAGTTLSIYRLAGVYFEENKK